MTEDMEKRCVDCVSSRKTPDKFPCSRCEDFSHFCPNTIIQCSEEEDPTGRTAKDAGAKLDAGKPMAALLKDFGPALLEVAKVCTHGLVKYTRRGWLEVPDAHNRYDDAMMRHWLKESFEDFDPGSGLLHEAHVAWGALARLTFKLKELEEKNG